MRSGTGERFQTRTGHLSHSPQHANFLCGEWAFSFKPGRATSPIPPCMAPCVTLSFEGVSNPDGPPLPFHQECGDAFAHHTTLFQTRTGHLSHSTNTFSLNMLPGASDSNPDGPPLPFHQRFPLICFTVIN